MLLVENLVTELVQSIKLDRSRNNRDRREHIAAFYPYLFLYNSPVGTFTVSILKDNNTIFSQTFDSAAIKISIPTVDDYLHVFYPVVPVNPLILDSGIYSVKLTATGYTFSEGSYIGWIRQHENEQTKFEYVPSSDRENPLALRIKTFHKIEA